MSLPIVPQNSLPSVGVSRQFVGRSHGVSTSFFLVSAPPGKHVVLHYHDYDETIVVLEGRARCTVGEREYEAGSGDIVVIPAGTVHSFTNVGEGILRQIDIHASVDFVSHWLPLESPKHELPA